MKHQEKPEVQRVFEPVIPPHQPLSDEAKRYIREVPVIATVIHRGERKAHNAWKCLDQPGGCGCTCHAIAAGRRANARRSGPQGLWTGVMDARLRRGLQHGETVTSIAKALHVSISSIRNRVAELGESLRTGWYTQADITRMFSVSWRTVAQWRDDGLIVMERHGDGRWFRASHDEVTRFVRKQAGVLFDPAQMRQSDFRRLAEVSATANRRRGSRYGVAH